MHSNTARTNNAASANTQWTNQWVELDYSRTANLNGTDNICFAFKSVEGFSKISTYVGNTSTDGPFVYTGFRPAWIMVKRYTSTGSWVIVDIARDSVGNPLTSALLANDETFTESTGYLIDACSNGFKIRNSGTAQNGGGTFLYMAFAEHPFKYANAR